MTGTELVKAYYAALDSGDMDKAEQYLSEEYQLIDFISQPMDKNAVFDLLKRFKAALTNLRHSLSNIQAEGNVVKLNVQLSGTNSAQLDLSMMGIGIIPRTRRFIIFPSGNYEFIIKDGKIAEQRDISPISPNRRMSGMLRAMM
jgi:predicted ester cyclase